MTFLTERLADLRIHLDHLADLAPRVEGPESLRRDLSLHNDVLFSLLTIAQLVIDISGELSTRRGLAFSDYTQAVRNLSNYEEFGEDLVAHLARLPGFRNVLLHEYIDLDYSIAVSALRNLQPVRTFLAVVTELESEKS